MSLKPKSFVGGGAKPKRKAPKKRPLWRDLRLDTSATYIWNYEIGDDEQAYFDMSTNRFYFKTYGDERYTLIPKKDEINIEKHIRPQGWRDNRPVLPTDGGRLRFSFNGEPAYDTEDGFYVWDRAMRGYIILGEKDTKNVVRIERWPEDCEWGDESGRVLVKKSWSSGGEGSSGPSLTIYVDGKVHKIVGTGFTGTCIRGARHIEVYDMAQDISDNLPPKEKSK